MQLQIMEKMIQYYEGDPKRIQHFLKVYEFACLIAEEETKAGCMTEKEWETVKVAALVHDIGIKNAEQKYGSCNGKLQEQEGPKEAENLLRELGTMSEERIERVCYLVGHHHTYNQIDGMDYQVLVEADFLVNMYEDHLDLLHIKNTYKNIFKTSTGKRVCRIMFGFDGNEG